MVTSLSIPMNGLDRRGLILRFLVFICFLNFSGLNNGYTYLTVVSPLNVRDSVSLTSAAAKTFVRALAPVDAFHFLGKGRRWITRSTLWTASLFASCLKPAPERILRPAASRSAGQNLGSDLREVQFFSMKLDALSQVSGWEPAPSFTWGNRLTNIRPTMRFHASRDFRAPPHRRVRARSGISDSDGDAPSQAPSRARSSPRAVTTDSRNGIGFFVFNGGAR